MVTPPSLRRRLLSAILGVFIAAWIITTISAYVDSRNEVEHLLDSELEQVARALLTLSHHELAEQLKEAQSDSNKTLDIFGYDSPNTRTTNKLAFQVWIGDSLALRSSNSPPDRLSHITSGFTELDTADERWRVFSLTDEHKHMTAYVGQHFSARDDLVGATALRTIIPVFLAVPIIALLTWVCIGHALRPLDKVAERVARRSSFDLSPIEDPNFPTETKPLIDSLNTLFGRLGHAFETTRRFTADAAHELRTPLAGIAAQTDVALLATDSAVRSAALVNMKTAIKSMGHLVQQLLTLARCDSATSSTVFSQVDFSATVAGTVQQLEFAAEAQQIQVQFSGHESVTVEGCAMSLALITRNIVDNAIRYTPPGGAVAVNVDETDGKVCLRVTDTGPGIEPAQRELLFQRFYRGSQQHVPGSGLGLSIVQRCVELHGGDIEMQLPERGGLCVIVTLPKCHAMLPEHSMVAAVATAG